MKKFRSTKRFENFLRTSSQSTLKLTEDQIDLLSPWLNYTQILLAAENAEWVVRRAELQRDGLITFMLSRKQMCSCGEIAEHYHFGEPCCGSQYCCPEFEEEPDYEIEIAWAIGEIRKELRNRKENCAL